jgi:hypothetical protein
LSSRKHTAALPGAIPLASAADKIAHVHGAIKELLTRTTAHSGWLRRTPPFKAGAWNPSRARLTVALPSPFKGKLLKLWNFSENQKKLILFRNKLTIIAALFQRELKHKA